MTRYAKQVLWTDGEAITPADLNASQTNTWSAIIDSILGPAAASTLRDFGGSFSQAATGALFSVAGAGALSPVGSLGLVALPGTILQSTGTPDGEDGSLLPYVLGTSEQSFTFAAGDATHDRIDLVQAVISYLDDNSQTRDFQDATTGVVSSQSQNVRRRTQIVASVKQGTPGSSPVAPSPDSGYVAWATVRITAGQTGAIGLPQVDDLRFPFGRLTTELVMPWQMFGPASTWVPSTYGGERVNSGGTGSRYGLVAMCPEMSSSARCIGVSWFGSIASGGTVKLVRIPLETASGVGDGMVGSYTEVDDVVPVVGVGDWAQYGSRRPIWCNGYRASGAGGVGNTIGLGATALGVRFVGGSSSDYVNFVRFHLLRG